MNKRPKIKKTWKENEREQQVLQNMSLYLYKKWLGILSFQS
jgi:hypothetical protein